ncbi:MAG: hypothetical protein WCV80_03080 [Candidatus Paceibacterota bacterium]|jgi:hypothetical protein
MMKIGFIFFWGAIFIVVIGQSALYIGEATSIWWHIVSTIIGIPIILFVWLSFTVGGDVGFVASLRLPYEFKKIIIVVGQGYRKSFPWMYRK